MAVYAKVPESYVVHKMTCVLITNAITEKHVSFPGNKYPMVIADRQARLLQEQYRQTSDLLWRSDL